ncbi:MAG: ABC transporter substrate-binding protein [Alphaproteobacteria bacterium]
MFQTLGTPTNSAVHRYLNQKKVPQLFIATGASNGRPEGLLLGPAWQPNYQTEAQIYARYILESVADPKIAVLYQNDDYGKDSLEGLRKGLGEAADELIVGAVSYETSDATIDSQIVQLKETGANVFLNVATPKWASQAISKIADLGWEPVHLLNNVSNSVSAVLEPAGLDKAKGIISAAYYMGPGDPAWADHPAMRDFQAFMATYIPDGDAKSTFSAYAYGVAMTLEAVLEAAGDDLTRENVMKQAASLDHLEIPILLPGITLTTGPDDYAPIEQMQLERFNGSSWELFGEIVDGGAGN